MSSFPGFYRVFKAFMSELPLLNKICHFVPSSGTFKKILFLHIFFWQWHPSVNEARCCDIILQEVKCSKTANIERAYHYRYQPSASKINLLFKNIKYILSLLVSCSSLQQKSFPEFRHDLQILRML